MNRRSFLAATASGLLAAPHVRAAGASVLRFVPQVEPTVLDPVANTAAQVRNHAALVWDTLYGMDADYQPQPQMLAGHTVEANGTLWTLTLRDGLRFHDGTPVLARDAVASIRRWASVDGFGGVLMAATDELSAPDDRTLRFRLKAPFPLLPAALGRMSPRMPVIMPARLAATPASQPVAEVVGSGPFRFVAAERVAGSRLVYEKFDGYVPRPGGAPGFTSGPKVARVDRVEWTIMPEAATAADALRQGEIDWWETATPDLLPLLQAAPGVKTGVVDTTGVMAILRFNCLHPPFDNPAIRRAVLSAVSQAEFMSGFSDNPDLSRIPAGVFPPGTPMYAKEPLAPLTARPDLDAARRAIATAGYKGERVVVLGPSDHPVNSVTAQIGADLMKRLGLNVDYQAMDAPTMFQRRTRREDVDHGGWSVFPAAVGGMDTQDPAVSFLVPADGAKAWYGWPEDPALEKLRLAWFTTDGLPAQRALCAEIERELLILAPHLPLGQILQPAAWNAKLEGMLPGFPKFWNVTKPA